MQPIDLPEIDLQRCSGCAICVQVCPVSALAMQGDKPIFVRPDQCTYCIICEDRCPQRAIRCSFEIGWETGQ